MTVIYLNIGSNRGDSRGLLEKAVCGLAKAFPQAFLRRSHTVRSRAWGYESPHPFLNIGVALDFYPGSTVPEPLEVLDTVQALERSIAPDSPHRNADGTYRDRCLDIDIIDIRLDDGTAVVMDTPRLTLPHPRAEARAFVMEPMQVLCPGWKPENAALALAGHKKTIADMGRDTVAAFRAKQKMPLCVVLDNVRSLNNIGSVFRTADAFCLDSVVLCGICATPPSAAIHKTALGAEESVAWRYYDTTAGAVSALRADGWTICCLEQVHGSVPLCDFRPAPGQKIAIVSGNEVVGVDPAVVAGADVWLEIPQSGTKHSLNVAVSTAIALWHCYAAML